MVEQTQYPKLSMQPTKIQVDLSFWLAFTKLKLDEWKFSTVEEMHKRLGQLLMLRFPVEVSDSISAMRTSLGNTLQTKVDGLQNDVERALEEGDYLTIDLIFEEVKNATLADSYYVSNRV